MNDVKDVFIKARILSWDAYQCDPVLINSSLVLVGRIRPAINEVKLCSITTTYHRATTHG